MTEENWKKEDHHIAIVGTTIMFEDICGGSGRLEAKIHTQKVVLDIFNWVAAAAAGGALMITILQWVTTGVWWTTIIAFVLLTVLISLSHISKRKDEIANVANGMEMANDVYNHQIKMQVEEMREKMSTQEEELKNNKFKYNNRRAADRRKEK